MKAMTSSDDVTVLEFRLDSDALQRRVLELEDFVERVEANAADTIAMTEELAVAKDRAEAASQRAEDSEARTRAVLDAVVEAIFTLDTAGTIESANASAGRLFGYGTDAMIGKIVSSLMVAPDGLAAVWRDGSIEARDQILTFGSTLECLATGQDGGRFPVELTLSEMTISGEPKFTCVVRDITERKRADEVIRKLTLHDPLTGLSNRNEFHRRLDAAVKRADRQGTEVALLLVDLDRFKEINDSFGHPVGDELLKFVGKVLKEATRETDTVARIGGDEFGIVFSNVRNTELISGTAERLISKLSQPPILDGCLVRSGASIGVAVYPSDSTDVDELIRLSDKALYEAKKRGRGVYQFYDEVMDARARAENILDNDLRLALVRDELELHYQPQLDISDGTVIGVEALVRWRHPTRGILLPGEFIEHAERRGLIDEIGKQVLLIACKQAKVWHDEAIRPLRIAVNVSPNQFKSKDFVRTVRDTLKQTGTDPNWLELEITETAMMDETDEITERITQLTQMGVSVAIDDFGIGYSSLSYLKRFPIQKLKIDRSFVSKLFTSPEDAAITEAIVNLGRNLNLSAVAEGVETKEQADILRRMNCSSVQRPTRN